MEYLEFILYGLIQGLTEFIPVSSTAHLKIISLLFGIDDPGTSISAVIQIGSVLALFWYFRRDLFLYKKSKFNKNLNSFLSLKLLKSIFIGTLPIIFFGGIIKLFIPGFFESILRSNLSIGVVSLLMALLMYIADLSKDRFINIPNHKYQDSFLIGIVQAFAIIPGVSRSGITISTALLTGWEKRDAARFSFLLGIPAISLAAITEFIFSLNQYSTFSLLPLLLGLVSAFLSSLLAIHFLLSHLTSNGLKLFIYYRLVFGILILLNL